MDDLGRQGPNFLKGGAMSRTALVLGAGIGGIVVAETLRRLLPRTDRVVVVERAERHYFPPSLLWLMVGDRSPGGVTRPFHRLASRDIELIRATVRRIDPARREVELDGKTLRGDALIIALGADYAPEAIPGLAEAGHCIYTLDGAAAIRGALERFSGGRIVVLTATPQYKCPAAPYEAAMLVDSFCRAKGIRGRTRIDLYAAEAGPMLVAGPAVTAAVRGMVEQRDIAYHPEHQVTAVDGQARRLSFANGSEADFDLLLYVPPHRAPAAVREAGLVNESGWIPVDRHTLQTRYEGVFALGDVTTIPLKMGRPLPKAGVFAHGQADVVAHNLAFAWTGKGAPRRFEGEGSCFIEVGSGRAGMGRGNFFAEPVPQLRMREPSRLWHVGKILYEKFWLYRHF
jgi:sulfide:quinone oxidoreductase